MISLSRRLQEQTESPGRRSMKKCGKKEGKLMDSTLTNTHDKKEETPVIRHEGNGVKITITFAEKTGEEM